MYVHASMYVYMYINIYAYVHAYIHTNGRSEGFDRDTEAWNAWLIAKYLPT